MKKQEILFKRKERKVRKRKGRNGNPLTPD